MKDPFAYLVVRVAHRRVIAGALLRELESQDGEDHRETVFLTRQQPDTQITHSGLSRICPESDENTRAGFL